VIEGLRHRIEARELETAIRDYIAKHPWLISPRWDTFRVETRIGSLVQEALEQSGINSDVAWQGRVDLVLSSGGELLILEFMRPGLSVDRDHLDRFQRYIDILKPKVKANSGLRFEIVIGMLVADRLDRKPENLEAIERMADYGMLCQEWSVLLADAASQWKEFLDALIQRSPEDDRVKALADSAEGAGPRSEK
jgi:hypothetical protein